MPKPPTTSGKKKSTGRGPGRPKAAIDWQEVGRLLESGCTAEGIAASIGVARNVLYDRCQTDNNLDFSTFSQQKRAKGDDLLREKQFAVAMSGDKTLLVWLGKQRLGQADKQEVTTDPRINDLKSKIQARANEKGVSYEAELALWNEKYSDNVPPEIKQELISKSVN